MPATLRVDAPAVARQARRNAACLVAPTGRAPAPLTDHELVQPAPQPHRVARGLAFLTAPLFLAVSRWVQPPERIVARRLVMGVGWLVERRAAHRRRERWAAAGHPVPRSVKQPTNRPTRRGMGPGFEGSRRVRCLLPHGPPQQEIAGVEPLLAPLIRCLGPVCAHLSALSA